jgi:hypothetical protein
MTGAPRPTLRLSSRSFAGLSVRREWRSGVGSGHRFLPRGKFLYHVADIATWWAAGQSRETGYPMKRRMLNARATTDVISSASTAPPRSRPALAPRQRLRRIAAVVLAAAFVVVSIQSLPLRADAATVTVAANFAVPVDNPLIKNKFAVYNSCIVPSSQYNRDINLINDIKPESLRIDGGLGAAPFCGLAPNPVTGTVGNVQYDFTSTDRLVSQLDTRGVLPYWSYSYEPAPLQIGGDWRVASRRASRAGSRYSTPTPRISSRRMNRSGITRSGTNPTSEAPSSPGR